MNKKLRFILTAVFSVLYLLLLGYMLSQALTSGEGSKEESGRIIAYLVRYDIFAKLSASGQLDEIVRKFIGHFCEYGLLGMIGFFLFFFAIEKPYGQICSFSLGVVSCFATEIAQLFAEDRSASVLDVLVDFQGYATAFLILSAIVYLVALIRKTNREPYIRSYLLCAPFIAAAIIPYIFIKELSLGKVVCHYVFLSAFVISSLFILIAHLVSTKKKPL